MTKHGHLFVISGPSGVGKSTLLELLLETCPDLHYSVSYTTREPRTGEQDGVNYFFVNKQTFQNKIAAGDFAEWAQVHGCFYGTCSSYIRKMLSSGQDVIMDIDVIGAKNIMNTHPEAVSIFIAPPSWEELERRLGSRGTESTSAIATRLANARKELEQSNIYKHVITNDDIEQTVGKLLDIIEKEREHG